jgi:hypothetical protein
MKCRREEHMAYVLIVKRNSHLVIGAGDHNFSC